MGSAVFLLQPEQVAKLVKGAGFRKAVSQVPQNLLCMTEEELLYKFKPTMTDLKLKKRFWDEICPAFDRNQQIKASNIYGGVCSYTHWYNGFLGDMNRVAWLLAPLNVHHTGARASDQANAILSSIREILDMPNTTNGAINCDALAAKIEIFVAVLNRLKI